MNVFQFFKLTDEMLSRTFLVQNETADPSSGGSKLTEQWVCYSRTDDSFESELSAHLPPSVKLTVQLQDVIYDPLQHTTLWKQEPRRLSLPDYRAALSLHQAAKTESQTVASLYDSDEFTRGLRPAGGWPVYDQPAPSRDVPGVRYEPGDVLVRVSFPGRPPPSRLMRDSCEAVGVSEMNFQILSGLRAVLVTLLDTAGQMCTDGAQYLGEAPMGDVYAAMDIMSKWSLAEFVPNVKYWKDFPLASFLRNALPAVPTSWSTHLLPPGCPLFGGRLRAYWRRLCTHLNDSPQASQAFRACFSLAQSKRGFAPVPASFIQGSYQKHAASLSRPAPDLSPETSKDLDLFLAVFFRNYKPQDLMNELSRQEASTSASNVTSRVRGGARREIREDLSTFFDARMDGLVRMVETDQGVVEERGLLPPSPQEWIDLAARPLEFKYHELPSSVQAAIPGEWKDKPFSQVVALQEPLKCRIITKMQTLSTHLCGPLQRSLWNYLRQFPCFDLTSRTFSLENVYALQSREDESYGIREDADWVSGDYSSATDGLNLHATKRVLAKAESKLEGNDRLLIPHARAVLLEQVLVYPPEAEQDPVLQANGQLMGSVLSFPILCILNLFTYTQSLAPDVRKLVYSGRISLKKLATLINGDDILFKADPNQYLRWLEGVKSIGFTLSLGKNFIHPRFFTVNSLPLEYNLLPAPVTSSRTGGRVLWTADTTRSGSLILPNPLAWADLDELPDWALKKSHLFQMHGYLNVGLLLGVSKAVDERGRHELTPLSTWYDWAVTGAMDTVRAHALFLHYHKEELRRQTRFGRHTLNLFAHPLLGGLGFKVPEGVVPRFSEPQRHLAARLLAAARQGFVGPVEDHPHKPFAYLSATTVGAPSLGTSGGLRIVSTDLEVPIGPLGSGQAPFAPDTSVRATPLAMEYGDPDEVKLSPSCRLSNAELTRLLRSANHGRATTLSPAEMTSFPYRVVTYDDDWMERWLTLSCPGWEQRMPPVQDPPPIIIDTPITVQVPVLVVPEVVPEYDHSWEDSPPPPPPLVRQVASQPKPRLGRQRFQLARNNEISMGLRPDYTPNERQSRWSRKGRRW